MIILDTEKQPWETKDYDAIYSDWLAPGDTITSVLPATVVCLTDPADTTLVINSTAVVSTSMVKVWLTGGTDKHKYKVTIRATTTGTRGEEVEMIIRVKDR